MHMACSAVGAVDRRGQQNTLFVTFAGVPNDLEHTEANFFAEFYGFFVLTSRLDAQISRFGNFRANRRQIIPIALPLAYTRGVIMWKIREYLTV